MNDHYGLYRILGNDLPPRHHDNQTLDNLNFMLEHEDNFNLCDKWWCINRIVNAGKREKLIKTLDEYNQNWFEIPFNSSQYKEMQSDHAKAHYITNINPARNQCLNHGLNKEGQLVTLILDGGCAMRTKAWDEFVENSLINQNDGYFCLPLWRLDEYSHYLDDNFKPSILEKYTLTDGRTFVARREPMIAFTQHSDLRFDPDLLYGKCNKTELLLRLGVPGAWDIWFPDVRKRAQQKSKSKFFGNVKWFSYTCRLPSGNIELDKHMLLRAKARNEGLRRIINLADKVSP